MVNKQIISFLIPVYNHQNYIKQTIQSVLSQKSNNDYEIIIVDDCSSDNSWSIIHKIAKKNYKITAIHNTQNLGLIANWKKMIDLAKGDWLVFLEGDDYLFNNYLEEKTKVISLYPEVGMIYSSFRIINDKNQILLKDYYKYYKIKTFCNEKISLKNYISSQQGYFSSYSQIMVKKNIIKTIGYPRTFHNEKMFLPSDWDFNLRISTNTNVYFIAKPLLAYRKHSSSNSKNFSKKYEQIMQVLLEIKKENLHNQGVLKAIKLQTMYAQYHYILGQLENGLKHKAQKNFYLYLKRYKFEIIRYNIFNNCKLFFRLIIPSKIDTLIINNYYKR